MRLWHIDLIAYLPKSQLLAQWRELNSIFKKQDKHILINYIYYYDKKYLWDYSLKVISEMRFRYNTMNTNLEKFKQYFSDMDNIYYRQDCERFKEHNNDYLTICYYNLKEKYIRGQKDFTADVWKKLDEFYEREMGNNE